ARRHGDAGVRIPGVAGVPSAVDPPPAGVFPSAGPLVGVAPGGSPAGQRLARTGSSPDSIMDKRSYVFRRPSLDLILHAQDSSAGLTCRTEVRNLGFFNPTLSRSPLSIAGLTGYGFSSRRVDRLGLSSAVWRMSRDSSMLPRPVTRAPRRNCSHSSTTNCAS